MISFTKHTLKKIETLMGELGYTIRYEKGSFNSGYCLVEKRKIAIINRFYDAEARINALLDILFSIKVDPQMFSETSTKLWSKIKKHHDVIEEDTVNDK